MDEIIRIKRQVKPGKKSLSGRSYGIYEYNNAIKKIEEKIKNEELDAEIVIGLTDEEYIDMLSDRYHGMRNIDKNNTCGTIVSIGDSYIDLRLNDDKDLEKIFKLYEETGITPRACMRYLAEKSIFALNKKVNLIDIITFDIVFPKIDIDLRRPVIDNTIRSLHKKYKGVCKTNKIYKENNDDKKRY